VPSANHCKEPTRPPAGSLLKWTRIRFTDRPLTKNENDEMPNRFYRLPLFRCARVCGARVTT
jgi:hypothetical protein